ncbi:MAG TPA: RNA polymerase sigma factor [Polyangiales bacterium]|nr:RNA polymerase sigma factor [Polyangiales bacterium]
MSSDPERVDPSAAEADPLAPLLDAAILGDPEAVRALLRALAPEVARVVRAILGPADAGLEDATQDSLLALVHALPGFRRDCGARHFANRIAARTALRQRRRSTAALQRDGLAELARRARQPGERELRQSTFVRQLLGELPKAQAEVLALRFVLGFSLEETARAVDAPVNTVRTRVRLAKEAIRERLEADAALARWLEGDP